MSSRATPGDTMMKVKKLRQHPAKSLGLSGRKELKQNFDRDGYVALPNFLGMNEIEELRGEVDRYTREVAPNLPGAEVFYEVKGQADSIKQLQRMFKYDLYFEQFFFAPRFVQLAEALLGGPVIGKNLQWFNKPPRVGRATPPHQDGYYFTLEPSEAVTMWLALNRVDEENGCVRYVRGSHRGGMRPHGRTETLGFSQGILDYNDDDGRREVPMIARPGDLLAHHAMTIHRADANPTGRPRQAIGFIFYAASAKEDADRQASYRSALTEEWKRQGRI